MNVQMDENFPNDKNIVAHEVNLKMKTLH